MHVRRATRPGVRRHTLGWLLLACLLLGATAPGPAAADLAEDEARRWAKDAAAQLAKGDATGALTAAENGLEFAAEDPELLRLASQAAEKDGTKDKALWYARLGLADAVARGAKTGELKPWASRVATLDPVAAEHQAVLTEYAGHLLALAEGCVRRKLYANAVTFYARCLSTPRIADAQKGLEKLYKNKRAVESLIQSGVNVPLRFKSRKSAARIAREDARHATWKKAWEIKGANYTVKTNMGYEVAIAVSSTMEQANRFYREVFDYKRRGGNTARCEIRLYKTRDGFLNHEHVEDDESLMGFFQPGQNYVATFDPRDAGRKYTELWETLFHECLHQFTEMVMPSGIPGWLDEGLATYFEGTRRLANGRVEANLAHPGRLGSLLDVLKEGTPTFRQVISYAGEGSFDASYYPVAYGIVYFLKNYENDKAERVYDPVFRAYMKEYHSGGKHDIVERFETYFVKKAKQEGIDSLADFIRRWKTWIVNEARIVHGGLEQADVLLARARKQLAHGKEDAAMATYRWVLRKRPRDHEALLALARLFGKRGKKDAAIYTYRELRVVCERADDPDAKLSGLDQTPAELRALCTAEIAKVDSKLAKDADAADAAFEKRLLAAVEAYAKQDLPRTALWLLDAGQDALGGAVALSAKRTALANEHGVLGARWRRLVADEEMTRWYRMTGWTAEDGIISAERTPESIELYYLEEMPLRYRLEVTASMSDLKDVGFLGVMFGVDESFEADIFGVNADGSSDLSRVLTEWVVLQSFSSLAKPVSESFRFGVAVDHGTVTFFLGDSPVGRREYPPAEMRGRIGIYLQDAAARITAIRVAY